MAPTKKKNASKMQDLHIYKGNGREISRAGESSFHGKPCDGRGKGEQWQSCKSSSMLYLKRDFSFSTLIDDSLQKQKIVADNWECRTLPVDRKSTVADLEMKCSTVKD